LTLPPGALLGELLEHLGALALRVFDGDDVAELYDDGLLRGRGRGERECEQSGYPPADLHDVLQN
jgi:hypothetical protein